MNEKLPKPMLDALAREAAPAEHPSADVLAAFVEHTLAGGDSRKVADHLARCGECREVVFLASNAAEESVAEEEDLMVAAVGRARQQQLVVDYYDSGMAATKLALPQKPRRRWMARLLWAAPIAAVLLVAAGYFTLGHRGYRASAPEMAASMSREPVVQPASPQEKMAAPAPAPEVAAPVSAKPQLKGPPAKATAARAAPAGKAPPEAYDAMATSAVPPAPAAASVPPEKANTELANAKQDTVAVTIGGVSRTAPPAPKANAFAPSANESSWQYGQADSLNLSVSRALNAAHPGWRVTVQGHLEHVTPDGWVRVLADETNAFRVVSVVGSEVWAGGNRGALFHSGDGGQHWKKVSLMTANGTETASIVSIRFDNSQHGVATTDNGSSYVTNDGGVSWIRQ